MLSAPLGERPSTGVSRFTRVRVECELRLECQAELVESLHLALHLDVVGSRQVRLVDHWMADEILQPAAELCHRRGSQQDRPTE